MSITLTTQDFAGPASALSPGQGHFSVSYSRWDRPCAEWLVGQLRASDVPVWIFGGRPHCPAWRDEVFPRIAGSDALIVLMTPHSRRARGVHEEIDYADSIGKPVIAVAVDGYRFPGKRWTENALARVS